MKDKLPANCYENLGLASDVEGFLQNALTLWVKRFISNQFPSRRNTAEKKEKIQEKVETKMSEPGMKYKERERTGRIKSGSLAKKNEDEKLACI